MFKYNDIIGIPFKDGGRSKQEGFDCWGLALELFRRQGIDLSDYKISSEATMAVSDEMGRALPTKWKKLTAPTEGCLVVIRMLPEGWANHCGIYIGYGKFIHAYCDETGVVIDRLKRWGPRVVGFYWPMEAAYEQRFNDHSK